MATNLFSVESSDGWVQVAADSEDFLLENRSSGIVYVTLQTAAPTLSEEAYHTVVAGEAMVRTGGGDVYLRNPTDEPPSVVVVTT